MDLFKKLVQEFAISLQEVDKTVPNAKNYDSGIGPHEEPDVVAHVIKNIRSYES
tara:strand:- start:419 stop:580 length:162 start_codon:yes stop_codon:yes gene_type:complete